MRRPPLRWRAAKGLPHVWSGLLPVPAANTGFLEASEYFIEKPGFDWALRVDDESLDDAAGNPNLWGWAPRFFAGEVTAELVDPAGRTAEIFLLDVAPDPGKMGRMVFQRMLDELWNEDPALVIGSEPATAQIGELGSTQNVWLEFARFRRYVPEVLQALKTMRDKPRRTLRMVRVGAPLRSVRRVDHRTAMTLVRSAAAALLVPDSGDVQSLNSDTRLDVPFIEESLDSAANRMILALVHALMRRGRSLLIRLQKNVESEAESETRTSLARRWPVRQGLLHALISRLAVASRQHPFNAVRRAEISAAGLTAVSADPTYARTWSKGWRAVRHGLDGQERTERLWVSPSWEIYERWCFLRLGKLLQAALPAWVWMYDNGPPRWVGRIGDRTAALLLQPTFHSNVHGPDKMWSVSRERVPDIVLTVDDSQMKRFVVLDAKYRRTRGNVLDAMASAHIYQDSLRLGGQRPDASLLLVPAAGGAEWLESSSFQVQHRVGVCPFAPGGTLELPLLVRRILEGTP